MLEAERGSAAIAIPWYADLFWNTLSRMAVRPRSRGGVEDYGASMDERSPDRGWYACGCW